MPIANACLNCGAPTPLRRDFCDKPCAARYVREHGGGARNTLHLPARRAMERL